MDTIVADILGSEYTIKFLDPKKDKDLDGNYGICRNNSREIKISTIDSWDDPMDSYTTKQTLRHEILHAYLYEAGLGESSLATDCWATNEEMVDWFARMWPKINETYKQVGCEEEV